VLNIEIMASYKTYSMSLIVCVSVVMATLSYIITPVTAADEGYDAAAAVNWYFTAHHH